MNINYKKIIGSVIAISYFSYCALFPYEAHIIDSVNLIFHEAGHTLLYFFGHVLYFTGGTLFEIGIPALVSIYFIRKRDFFSAAIIGLWLGQVVVGVSIYAGDAVSQQLPLLGGDSVEHDWFTILNEFGLLKYTSLISQSLEMLGFIILLISIFLTLHISFGGELRFRSNKDSQF